MAVRAGVRCVVLTALVLLAGCSGSHHTTSSTSTTSPPADLSRALLRPADLPGWRQVSLPGPESHSSRAKDAAVGACMGGDLRIRGAIEGSTFVHGGSSDLQEIQDSAAQYRSPDAPEAIARSPKWLSCSAESVREQIDTAATAHLQGKVHASMHRVDLSGHVAVIRITYALLVGPTTRTYVEDEAMVWHGDVVTTIDLDRIGAPTSPALEDRLLALAASRL